MVHKGGSSSRRRRSVVPSPLLARGYPPHASDVPVAGHAAGVLVHVHHTWLAGRLVSRSRSRHPWIGVVIEVSAVCCHLGRARSQLQWWHVVVALLLRVMALLLHDLERYA